MNNTDIYKGWQIVTWQKPDTQKWSYSASKDGWPMIAGEYLHKCSLAAQFAAKEHIDKL